MADESKWWPRIMGHVLRFHGSEANTSIRIGVLRVHVGGDVRRRIRAYSEESDYLGTIYLGKDLLECRDAIAEYFRTREMFPVDQDQERTSA
jgi:hypothetical protein